MQKIILIILLFGICKFSNAQEVSKNRIKTLGVFGNTIYDYTIKAFLKLDSLEVKNVNVTGTFYTSFQVTNNQIKNLGFFYGGIDFFRKVVTEAMNSIPEEALRNLNSINDEYYVLPIHHDFKLENYNLSALNQKIEQFRGMNSMNSLSFSQEFQKALNIENGQVDGVRVIFLAPLKIVRPHVRAQ